MLIVKLHDESIRSDYCSTMSVKSQHHMENFFMIVSQKFSHRLRDISLFNANKRYKKNKFGQRVRYPYFDNIDDGYLEKKTEQKNFKLCLPTIQIFCNFFHNSRYYNVYY